MKHIDEDTLLKKSLGILEDGEESALDEHLSVCADCTERLEQIRRDMELIGSLDPKIQRAHIPLPRKQTPRIHAWFKVAALLILGFAGGYGVSQLSDGRVVSIVSYRVHPLPSYQEIPGFTQCESVDLASESFPEAPEDSVSR